MIPSSPGHAGRRRRPAFAVLVAAAFAIAVLGSCTTSSARPAPTPADFGGIAQILQVRGLTLIDVVSGDAGCPGSDLARTAIHFRASGLDQASPTSVYLYIFNDQSAFQRRAGDVASCARSYVVEGTELESIDVSPYVVAGPGPWAPDFRAELRAGLTVAAGDGGTGGGQTAP